MKGLSLLSSFQSKRLVVSEEKIFIENNFLLKDFWKSIIFLCIILIVKKN